VALSPAVRTSGGDVAGLRLGDPRCRPRGDARSGAGPSDRKEGAVKGTPALARFSAATNGFIAVRALGHWLTAAG
jgi:hypothetical protein